LSISWLADLYLLVDVALLHTLNGHLAADVFAQLEVGAPVLLEQGANCSGSAILRREARSSPRRAARRQMRTP
jgi:hypothetical protein